MSTTTSNLGLFKYDVSTDTNIPFSITEALNNNWDIIDEKCGRSGLVKNQTPYDCINEMQPRDAQLFAATLYSETEYTTSNTYTMELTEGDYQVEMYGAGGNSYGTWTYQKAQGWQGGGSGAGFKGVVHLPAGNYQVYVGAVTDGAGQATTFKNTNNDITYITAGGGGYNGNGFSWDSSTNWRAPGGTLTIHADTQVISSKISRNGEAGNQWGNQFWINKTISDGGKSVYNGADGWGCGQKGGTSCNYTRKGGYFKISKLGTEFSNLKINDFTATDINGESFEIIGLASVNMSAYSKGTYNLYINKERKVTVIQNTNYVQSTEPDNPVDGDVWKDISGYPIKKYKYTLVEDVLTREEFTDIYLGKVTLGLTEDSNIAITSINPVLMNKGVFPAITETYVNGTSWYRVYSDSWCEQGGRVAIASMQYGSTSVSLLKPFKDTNYTITIGGRNLTNNGNYCFTVGNSVTTNSFTIWTERTTGGNHDNQCYWQACGYIN